LAFLANFDPYQLFALLDFSEADLAAAVLHYKGTVLDSVIEDRRRAEASQDGENRKLLEHLEKCNQELGVLLLQTHKKPRLKYQNTLNNWKRQSNRPRANLH